MKAAMKTRPAVSEKREGEARGPSYRRQEAGLEGTGRDHRLVRNRL